MNKLTNLTPERRNEVLQERFAQRVAAALTEQQALSPRRDIEERLRVARDQALGRAREARLGAAGPAVVTTGGGTVALGSPSDANGSPWWLRLSSLLPLAVLLAGLMLIDRHYTQSQIEAAAEVDAALLADDLPPEAYRDPGFAEFLKGERR
jgi:protein-S-isoprenylcysteine O-methyltransferase Ste14